MTRRVFRPAACEGAAPSFPLVPRSTQTVRRMLPRQHALALAIIAATATLTPGAALAQACARSDNGGLTRFDRPAGVAPGGVYDWPYPDPRPGFIDPYDTRDNTRVEIGNCRVHLGSTEITTPNAIAPEDWLGWVQERGLYIPDAWDEHYAPLVRTSDPGEDIPPGSCLICEYGEGTYLYTALVWYRQLREAHPGALRLFANMLALGK